MDFSIGSQRVVTPRGIRPAIVAVRDGRIEAVLDESEAAPDIDIGDKMLLPGLVDPHVHINEPGRTEWEGFATATRAAAAGGYTTLIDMPLNCLPETTTVDALNNKREAAAGQCLVDYGFWGGVVADNQSHIEPMAAAGVLGFKCFLIYPGIEGFTMVTQQQLEAALPHVARTGRPLLTHAEVAGPIDDARMRLIESEASWDKYSTYLASRPDEAELTAIRLMIRLCRTYKCRVYIVHLSSARALPELLEARAEGLPITVETCPHYLHFEAEQIPDCAVLYKCAPPIRGRANRLLLWDALESGIIDLIGTDHSPCLPHMKEGDFQTAWGGIASLSIALPVIWTEAKRRKIPITRIVEWMSQRPAQVAGIAHRKGRIAEGLDADLVVFDPDATTVVEPGSLRYRHPISPYMNETLRGSIDMTFVRGTRVYDHGQFPSSPDGREVTRR